MRSAPRPETVAVLGKGRGETRLENLQDALLDEPVEDSRDP
jgi:hypothetical protein